KAPHSQCVFHRIHFNHHEKHLHQSHTLFPYTTLFRSLQRWAHLDSNQDLTGYEPAALPLSYGPSAPSYPVTSRESSGAFSRRDRDRKSTRLNSSYVASSYAVFCLNKQD